MKSAWLIAFLGMVLATGCAHAAQAPSPIASQGETQITATIGKLKVQVRIKTHELQIGKPSDTRPTVIETNCTYSRYPCSIVDRVEIMVNGKPLFIPRSTFCDLADLHKAEIRADEKGPILTLYGGDASESYMVKIEFDETRVKRRTLSTVMSADQPLQETTYHVQVLGE
jgi:hypothetical protein